MSREGSIKRDKSGRWFLVLDATPAGAPKRKQIRRRGFRTKAEAIAALDEVKRTLNSGSYVEPSKLTMEQYLLEKWLPSLSIRPTTADTYRRLVRLHILPKLGDVALQRLDRARVAQWLTDLATSPMSAKSVRNVHGVALEGSG